MYISLSAAPPSSSRTGGSFQFSRQQVAEHSIPAGPRKSTFSGKQITQTQRLAVTSRFGCWSRCFAALSKEAQRSPSDAENQLNILRQAAFAVFSGGSRPKPAEVADSLLEVEKAEKAKKLGRIDLKDVAGQWTVVFVDDPRKRNNLERFISSRYFPVKNRQTFIVAEEKNAGTFDNGLFLGLFSLRFRGPFRWYPAQSRLEFTVDTLIFKLGFLPSFVKYFPENKLELQDRKTLPFFTFFLLDAENGILAGRGRGGGLALYTRVPTEEIVQDSFVVS